MKRLSTRLIQVAMVFVLGLVCNLALAADLTGTWAVNVVLAMGPGSATFELKQDSNALSGSYSGALGTAPLTGSVEGDSFKWSYTIENLGVVSYTGSVQPDGSIKGDADYGQTLGKATFTGTRQ